MAPAIWVIGSLVRRAVIRHSHTVPSQPLLASTWPSGVNSDEKTPPGTLPNSRGLPVSPTPSTLHSRVRPSPVVAKVPPSGENATPHTIDAVPLISARCRGELRFVTSHSLAEWSHEPVPIVRPSGLGSFLPFAASESTVTE